MLAPSGGGLILYQAYGNLYAMTGRKSHLLEDKQISNVGVFDEGGWRLHRRHKRRHRDLSSDGVRNFATASGRGRLKEDLESSTWRRFGNHVKEILLKLNLPNHRSRRWCSNLTLVESDSLPHARDQAIKTYNKHQDSRIKKAPELKTKTPATLIFKIFHKDIKIIKTKDYQGILLASFLHDAKYEHIENGKTALALFDIWNENCPLITHMSNRAINAGFSLQDNVSDAVLNGSWSWPTAWYDMLPVLLNLPTPILNDEQGDIFQWRTRDGSFRSFSIQDAWNSVREHGNKVD
ncbi:hypothetical protein Tco_1293833 [Tanacetum coccineum]